MKRNFRDTTKLQVLFLMTLMRNSLELYKKIENTLASEGDWKKNNHGEGIQKIVMGHKTGYEK